MKRKILKSTILLLLIIVTIWLLYFKVILGKKPFKNLNSSDISSISVLANPPNRTVLIHENKQIKEVVGSLNNIVTYQMDDSSKYTVGQFVQFTLTMKDGSTLKIGNYGNLFIKINGKIYKTKYAPCEILNKLGNKLIDGV
ncbi:hypothetical protein [Clostridium estertheticum]|uniref:hypothetical protein n=1 Tax=Clostridium estertheticum TaxID=238834 RepID=UPI001CF51AE6|nr:hypothetical protein [Clostridium estertheticum]MCB2356114.1 hypothetical protein [Clostridium estertheticum]WAG43735.1 hypothetical protein LL065_23935 [Clostridium estertheticum]